MSNLTKARPPKRELGRARTGAGLAVPDAEQAARVAQKVFDVQEKGTPKNTVLAYSGDWKAFSAWCKAWKQPTFCGHSREERAAFEATLVLYLSYLADEGYRATTIERALAGICAQHKGQGYPSPRTPLVVDHLAKTKRVVGTALDQAAPLLVSDLERIAEAMGEKLSPLVLRDRAVLLIGWAGAMRRSEIAALDLGDMQLRDKGLIVRLRQSKTDQERRGVEISIHRAARAELCPVRAYQAWRAYRDAESPSGEHLFCLSHRQTLRLTERMPGWQLEKIITRWVRLADLVPEDQEQDYSPHSLRAGFITEAARAGKTGEVIMNHSRHKTHSVFMGYIRKAVPFAHHPGEGLL